MMTRMRGHSAVVIGIVAGIVCLTAGSATAKSGEPPAEDVAELTFAAWAQNAGTPVTAVACNIDSAGTAICYGVGTDGQPVVAWSPQSNGQYPAFTRGAGATAAPQLAATSDGTRSSPIPLGTPADIGAGWTLAINGANLDAWATIQAANSFNEAPADDNVYVMANITTTYNGTEDGAMDALLLSGVTSANVEINSFDTFVVAPDPYDSMASVFPGASKTGNVVFEMPASEATTLVLIGSTFLGDKTVYFATA